MTVSTVVQPIETGGQYWIVVSVDGGELPRRGPFVTAYEAQAVAARLAAICRGVFHQPVHIGAVRRPAAKQRQRERPLGDLP